MSPLLPVSVKGIVRIGGRFALLENDRGTWELPGGRLESGEQPHEAVAREIEEELNITVQVGDLIDAYVFEPIPDRAVLILVYDTKVNDPSTLAISDEHSALGLFSAEELADLDLAEGYRRALIKGGMPAHAQGL